LEERRVIHADTVVVNVFPSGFAGVVGRGGDVDERGVEIPQQLRVAALQMLKDALPVGDAHVREAAQPPAEDEIRQRVLHQQQALPESLALLPPLVSEILIDQRNEVRNLHPEIFAGDGFADGEENVRGLAVEKVERVLIDLDYFLRPREQRENRRQYPAHGRVSSCC